MATLELQLDDGVKIYTKVEPSTSTPSAYEDVSRGREKLEASFTKVSASLKSIVSSIEDQLSTLAKRPTKFEIEMGVELKGEADFWIVSGEATGHMKITLSWEQK